MIVLNARVYAAAPASLGYAASPRGHMYAAPPTALVVRGSRITLVGSDEEARAAATAREPVVDVGGRLVTPAFVDAHLHAVQTGLVAAGVDLRDVGSAGELLERVDGFVRRSPAAGVIVGHGWDERTWADPRLPSRAELDRAAAGRPTYLARIDVHSALVSSALLAALAATAAEDIARAEGYSSDGPLTREAHHQCRGQMDRLFTDEQRRTAARSALQAAAAQGVATVHELGGPHLGPLADLTRVSEAGAELGMAVVPYWGELASAEAFERAHSVDAAGLAGDLCIDGALGSRTARLAEPYADAQTHGARYLSDSEIADHVVACTRAGVQAGFHCIGDAGVAAAVGGLRRAAEVLGVAAVAAARHRLEHVEMIDRADLATMAQLGVVASVQPAFDALWGGPGGLYDQRVGQRARSMNPFGSLHAAGVTLAFGTDAPVTPPAGWATVRHAAHHWRADERLDPAIAFAAATDGAHRAARMDDRGVLAVGRRADLSVWDAGDVGPDGLPDLDGDDPGCWATIGGGRVAYAAEPDRFE